MDDLMAEVRAALRARVYSIHYGQDLSDHKSVMPGDLIGACSDFPCPETRALIARLDGMTIVPATAVTFASREALVEAVRGALHNEAIGCHRDYRGDRDCDGRPSVHGDQAAAILRDPLVARLLPEAEG